MTKSTNDNNIFRTAALENLASTKRFEEPLQVVSYKKGLTKCSFIFIFIGALIWLIWGSIPIEAQGVAIAVNEGGLYNLDTSFSGFVQELRAPVEREVKKGDLLVVIDNPELNARLKTFQQTIDNLQTRLLNLQQEITQEKMGLIQSLEKGIQASEFKIQTLEKDIPLLEEDVRLKQFVAAKGLLNSESLQQIQELLWNKQVDLEKSKADLLHLHFLLKKEYRENEMIALEERLREVSKEKALAEAELQYNHIYSPIEGKVLEWFVQPGNYVTQGQLIARLEPTGQTSPFKIFYGYLPLKDKKIALNSLVKIELTNIKALEYGAMIGHISHISQNAVSPEFLKQTIHNPVLIDYLLQNKTAVFEVVIIPEHDPNTPSGYRWTSGKGPDIQLTSGTLSLFNGLIEEVSPLYYFFPVWWVKEKIYQVEHFFHSPEESPAS